jgi:Ca2+-binding RTX toxin-like protein
MDISGRMNKSVTGTNQDDSISIHGKANAWGRAGNDTFLHHGQTGFTTYSGGAGQVTLIFEEAYYEDEYDYEPGLPPGDKPWLDIRVTGAATGELGISSGPGAGDYIREGTFTGMNAFSAEGDIHQLFYKGGNSDNTVIGSYNNDFLVGGEGNETFAGSFGDDAFLFEFNPNGMGHDQVLDYTNIDPLEPPYGGMGLDFIGLVGTSGYNVRTETIDFGNSKIFQTYNITPTGEYVVHTLNVYGDINNLTMGNIPDIWF